MNPDRTRTAELISSLKQQRDQLALKVHLAEVAAKDEWERLDDKYAQWTHNFEPLKHAVEKASDDVWASLKLVGEEIKHGDDRIRQSL